MLFDITKGNHRWRSRQRRWQLRSCMLMLVVYFTPVLVCAQARRTMVVEIKYSAVLIDHDENYSLRDGITPEERRIFDVHDHSRAWGVEANLSVRIWRCLSITGGLAYHGRLIRGLTFLNQSRLPADRASNTLELVGNVKTRYHYIQMPIRIKVEPWWNKTYSPPLTAGMSANYLARAFYQPGIVKYQGPVTKAEWAGIGIVGGLQNSVKVSHRLSVVVGAEYSIVNPEYVDPLLLSQGPVDLGRGIYGIALTHSYWNFSLGIGVGLGGGEK